MFSTKEEFKYVYFNHMNLAMKTSLKKQAGQSGLLTKDLQHLITSIHNDFQGYAYGHINELSDMLTVLMV